MKGRDKKEREEEKVKIGEEGVEIMRMSKMGKRDLGAIIWMCKFIPYSLFLAFLVSVFFSSLEPFRDCRDAAFVMIEGPFLPLKAQSSPFISFFFRVLSIIWTKTQIYMRITTMHTHTNKQTNSRHNSAAFLG